MESERYRGKHMAFLLTESERATYDRSRRRVIGMFYISKEFIQKGMSLIKAVRTEVLFCQQTLLCVLHLQQVREGGRSL